MTPQTGDAGSASHVGLEVFCEPEFSFTQAEVLAIGWRVGVGGGKGGQDQLRSFPIPHLVLSRSPYATSSGG